MFFGFVILIGIGVGAIIGAWGVGRLSIADYDGEVALPGLSAPVHVKRDRYAVPRIEAQTMADAYRVLGYLHAQDRMFQMEMTRRVGAGRLAELIGPSVVTLDQLMRTLGLYMLAEQTVDTMDEAPRAALEAYAAGVNHWIDTHAGPLPPEYLILRTSPDPWTPADSVVWGYLMALQLSDNWRGEIARARLADRLTPEQVSDIWPSSPVDGPTTLAANFKHLCCRDPQIFKRMAQVIPGMTIASEVDLAGIPFAFASASNEWALSGDHTASGAPLLANDPHLGFSAPLLWYLAEILTPDQHLTGATVPGVPFMILGHNGHIAWGFTTTHADVQDLFIERPDPADPLRYLTPDGSTPFELRRETIDIRGEDSISMTVRTTRHGPVISDISDDAAALAQDGEIIALAFTALSPENKTSEAIYDMNRAHNWPEFVAALEKFHSPAQNIIYADVDGHIGFYLTGRLPVRQGGDGLLPVPGWTGDFDWRGYVPFARQPHRLDPPNGRLVNANNRVVPSDFPFMVTAEWPDGSRAQRIEERLAALDGATVEDFREIQTDIVSLPARQLIDVLLPLADVTASNETAVDLLRRWDGAMDRQRPEPLIYAAWLQHLVRQLTADELGDVAPPYGLERPAVLINMLTNRQVWCNNVMTPATESCAAIVDASLTAALADLREAVGETIDDWRWGDLHRARFGHQVLGRIPVLRDIIDVTIATDGGDGTVNRGTYRSVAAADGGPRFDHIHGAGFRAIYDLSDLARSQMIVATGQSGHPLSRHFGDFAEIWRDGGYLSPGLRVDGVGGFPRDQQIFRSPEF